MKTLEERTKIRIKLGRKNEKVGTEIKLEEKHKDWQQELSTK